MAVQIKTMEQLKKESANGADFFILLGNTGVLKSSKWILWDSEERIFFVRNLIDDSEQELSEKQMMNRDFTNIGYAMTKGALFLSG